MKTYLCSKTTKTKIGTRFNIAALAMGVVAALVVGPSGVVAAPAAKPAPVSVPVSAPAVLTPPVESAMTFQAWKNLRVDEARLVLERMTLEGQLEKMPQIERSPGEKQAVIRTASPSPRPRAGRAESRADARIEQARMNLEIARDLTVNDYLLIYLSQFKSRDILVDVARRMPPEDVAELLLSYQKLVAGGQIAEHTQVPSPRLSPRPL